MASASGSLFLGVTSSPAREMVAEVLLQHSPQVVYFPFSGRFAAIEAFLKVKGAGGGVEVQASDISLFSSILGTLSDPALEWASLGLQTPSNLPPPPNQEPISQAAQAMLALKLGQTKSTHQYGMNLRREILESWEAYHAQLVAKTQTMVNSLKGIRYQVMDVWAVLDEAKDREDVAVYINVPSGVSSYEKTVQASGITWNAPSVTPYDPKQFPEIIEILSKAKCTSVVYVQGSLKDLPTEGWQTVFAKQVGMDRAEYLITNRRARRSFAHAKLDPPDVQLLPIYNDEEITEKSKIRFLPVNADTAFYYRDLFVHKLGGTKAERYFLMLIDDRVVTALGIHTAMLQKFQSTYIHEVFGISKSSIRYARLGKLFMLALTSGEFRSMLMQNLKGICGVHEPMGVQTSSITTHTEGKTDRSVMKIASRELLKDGRYKIVYRAKFRTDSFEDILKLWLNKWGGLSRDKKAAAPPVQA